MPEVRAGLRPLFEPLTLRGRVLKNRIVSTAHAPGYAEGGMPGPRYQAYHEAKAKGGLALTMFGGSSIVSGDVTSIYGQIDVSTDRVIPIFREFAARIHAHGALLMCQISHMGRRTAWDAGDWIAPIAPSAIRDPAHHAMPRAMEEEDIARVLADYAAAARRCAEGGLDGCEIFVTSHLPGQFLSPAANVRDDRWGGPLDNRMRFLMEALRGVRAAVPDDFIVSLRMSPDESGEGGPDAEECLAVATAARDEGLIDLVNLIGPGGATNASIAQVIPGMALPLAPMDRNGEGLPRPDRNAGAPRHAHHRPRHGSACGGVGGGRPRRADARAHRRSADRAEGAGRAGGPHPPLRGRGLLHRPGLFREGRRLPPQCRDGARDVAPARGRTRPAAADRRGRGRRSGGDGGGAGACTPRAPGRPFRGDGTARGADPARRASGMAARHGGDRGLARSGASPSWAWMSASTPGPKRRRCCIEAPDIVIDATGGVPKAKSIPGGDLVLSTWDVLSSPPEAGRSVLIEDEVGGHQAVSLAEFLARRGCTVEICTRDGLSGANSAGRPIPSTSATSPAPASS
jgi:dimethylglycine catabolism A